ncbi:MAG: orotate phosphoribosyltransferase [Thermoleophilia bacterium]|nr:orotate phosphoribosyltransferase [Thermoleophilia bacterium]
MAPDATSPEATSPAVDPLVVSLFDRALLRGEFTLRSGATSDRYFDKYRVTCDPALLGPVATRLAATLAQVAPDAVRIAGPELGAVPLAAALALETGLPFAIVRGAAKAYGTANRIEGPIATGERAVLVEDVVTSGGAAIDALEVLRDAGIVVTHALCVLDRDGGGREALAAAGVQLHALLDAADLDAAFDAGLGTEVPA